MRRVLKSETSAQSLDDDMFDASKILLRNVRNVWKVAMVYFYSFNSNNLIFDKYLGVPGLLN